MLQVFIICLPTKASLAEKKILSNSQEDDFSNVYSLDDKMYHFYYSVYNYLAVLTEYKRVCIVSSKENSLQCVRTQHTDILRPSTSTCYDGSMVNNNSTMFCASLRFFSSNTKSIFSAQQID